MNFANGVEGKVYLVTGASSGIGWAIALLLARQGAKVLASGRNEDQLGRLCEQALGSKIVAVPHALSGMDDAYEWIVELIRHHGPLDGLVHSAGTRSLLPLRALKEPAAFQEFNIHALIPLGLIKGFRFKRPENRPGSIVLISSVMGLLGAHGQVAYGAAKAAMLGIARSASVELAREKIRVNAIAAGCVETEMLDTFRQSLTNEQFEKVVAEHLLGLGTADDVAQAAAFLVSPQAQWITGTTLVVDGGYTAH